MKQHRNEVTTVDLATWGIDTFTLARLTQLPSSTKDEVDEIASLLWHISIPGKGGSDHPIGHTDFFNGHRPPSALTDADRANTSVRYRLVQF